MKVLKDFKTLNQRFTAGSDIPATQDVSPLRIEDLQQGGFIEKPGAARGSSDAEVAPAAAAPVAAPKDVGQ